MLLHLFGQGRFNQTVPVFAFDDARSYAILQSDIHYCWALQYGASLRTDPRYLHSDCFETFPFPGEVMGLNVIGERYDDHRRQLMLARREGLTKLYNRFHDPNETSDDIEKLRQLHVEMDNSVAAAYGWTDLDLGHGFRETKQGIRYTISEAARREVLAHLLKLNHERYAEEVKQGLHEKKGRGTRGEGRAKKTGKKDDETGRLFD